MSEIMQRPTTPSPAARFDAGLLTPPPTTRFDKRCCVEATFDQEASRRRFNSTESEPVTSSLDDFERGLNVDSNTETVPSSKSSSPASPAFSPTKDESLNETYFFVSHTTAVWKSSITQPFPFLKLPLSVRKKVYEHLLVVPALIHLRQNTRVSDSQDHHVLLPGIATAHPCPAVSGPSIPFSHFPLTNAAILRTSKEIHTEARAVLYAHNTFSVPRPSLELSPQVDYSIRLFPPGCQRLVTSLHIQIKAFYDLGWLVSGGYNVLKTYYRGVKTLTLVLKLTGAEKGWVKKFARKQGEGKQEWKARLEAGIARGMCGKIEGETRVMRIPAWIELRVMFEGERYDAVPGSSANVGAEREELRWALVQAWGEVREVY